MVPRVAEPDADPAVRGRELHRVAQQVPDDLLETRSIAVDSAELRIGIDADADALGFRAGLNHLQRVHHH